jgi:negative regulator of flagellin synthesis FlgM
MKTRGDRMKVVSGSAVPGAGAAGSVADVPVATATTPASRTERPSASEALQSAVLAPAIEAARQAPDVDQARVAELRDALAKGSLPFDATKLAALIERYHRNAK